MSLAKCTFMITFAVSSSGCAGLQAIDQAAADMARQTPTCTPAPAIGADNHGGVHCSVTHVVRSSTTTTVQEPGKAPVTTRIVTTPSGTTTEIVPTP